MNIDDVPERFKIYTRMIIACSLTATFYTACAVLDRAMKLNTLDTLVVKVITVIGLVVSIGMFTWLVKYTIAEKFKLNMLIAWVISIMISLSIICIASGIGEKLAPIVLSITIIMILVGKVKHNSGSVGNEK